MATPIQGKYYRFNNVGATNAKGLKRRLNLYSSGSTADGMNVVLYDPDTSNEQVWKYGTNSKLHIKTNETFCLDRLNYASSANHNNADIWTALVAENANQQIEFEDKTTYIRIKLKGTSLYLTAYNNANGTGAGKTPKSDGNVYWAASSTSTLQRWTAEEVGGSSGGTGTQAIKVTGMPSGDRTTLYSGNVETFHPGSGMVNGTWSQNSGAAKVSAIKRFYKAVYGYDAAYNDAYLYNLFGAKYSGGTQYHSGVDMFGTGSLSIKSAHTGVVTCKGGSGYGEVGIYDAAKNKTYLYLHMNLTGSKAVIGQTINKGDLLGTQSDVGIPKSYHLHFEVRDGRCTNPAGLPLVTQSLTSISPYDYM